LCPAIILSNIEILHFEEIPLFPQGEFFRSTFVKPQLKGKIMEFNNQEKLGVIKAIDQVIRTDDRVYEGESFFLAQLSKVVKFDKALFDKARQLTLEEAIEILKEMPDSKKEVLAMMLNQAANSDGRVQEDELRTIHKIFTLAGMDFDDL
jgi:hypothetical protein